MKIPLTLLFALWLSGTVFCQLDSVDLHDGFPLDTVYYYNVKTDVKGEYKAGVVFKFREIADDYFHGTKDNHLFLEVYDAGLTGNPGPEKVGEPFKNFKITEKKENVQLVDDLTPRMRTMVRVDMELEEDAGFTYTVVGGQKVITLNILWSREGAPLEKRREFRKKVLKYSIAGVVVAGVATGIVWIFKNSSGDDETGKIHQR